MQFYYTEFMLLPAAVVASVLSISIIIDGVTDFLMGMVIDHLQTKKGQSSPVVPVDGNPDGACNRRRVLLSG